ncbi:MAG: hypothetical protein HKL85_13665 [Acidimicrobiaceae bacterium]|nr:hypothetical protein [Acidimicrobiaceae bacterium]
MAETEPVGALRELVSGARGTTAAYYGVISAPAVKVGQFSNFGLSHVYIANWSSKAGRRTWLTGKIDLGFSEVMLFAR